MRRQRHTCRRRGSVARPQLLALARAYLDARQLETGLSYLDRAVALDAACAQFAATTAAFAPYRDAPHFRAPLAGWQK
jgi:hypothetical protein